MFICVITEYGQGMMFGTLDEIFEKFKQEMISLGGKPERMYMDSDSYNIVNFYYGNYYVWIIRLISASKMPKMFKERPGAREKYNQKIRRMIGKVG